MHGFWLLLVAFSDRELGCLSVDDQGNKLFGFISIICYSVAGSCRADGNISRIDRNDGSVVIVFERPVEEIKQFAVGFMYGVLYFGLMRILHSPFTRRKRTRLIYMARGWTWDVSRWA